ncbi:MAG: nitroreductase, partial [Gammaproteobacteria bacterium]
MQVQSAIEERRAVRHFDPDHKISDADLRELLNGFALAPSSFNMQNRQVVAVVDPAIKKRIQAAAWGQQHVSDASVLMVMAGSLDAHKDPSRYLRDAPEALREQFTPMIGEFYGGKDRLIRDEACRSVGMAAMGLMLQAKGMGYESCPMIGFDPDQVAEIVGLDADHPPLMLIAVGKGVEPAHARLGLLEFEETVSVDSFGNRAITGTPG